jgi:hypothetical protein
VPIEEEEEEEMMDSVLNFSVDSVQILSLESFEVVLFLPFCEFQIRL